MNRHLTEDEISRAVVGQSTFEEQQHANGCAECRTEITRSLQILALVRQGLRSYAEYELRRSTPAVRRASTARHLTSSWAAAVGAVAVIAAALAWQGRSQNADDSSSQVRPAPEASTGHAGTVDVDVTDAFYALRYGTVPVTNGHIVRIEVPRSAPVAFGLDPVNFVSARRGSVLADVLVGEDGLARGVRFVRPATDDLRKE
jgi:hypothetical protein